MLRPPLAIPRTRLAATRTPFTHLSLGGVFTTPRRLPAPRRHISTSSSPTPNPVSPDSSTAPPQNDPAALSEKQSKRLGANAGRLSALAQRTGVPLPSLVLSFLVLHEATAVVPVVGIYYLLGYFGAGAGLAAWLAGLVDKDQLADQHQDQGADQDADTETRVAHVVHRWVDEGLARAERVGRRYGVLGFEKGSKREDGVGAAGITAGGAVADAVGAYVIVKALLPLRLAVSVAAAPAFARFALNPIQRGFQRLRRRA